MRKYKINGFTFAEMMVVLMIVGVISAILLPVAFKSTPNRNVVKFKKINHTFASVVKEVVSDGKKFKVGNLGKTPDDQYVCDIMSNGQCDLFCKTIADFYQVSDNKCSRVTGANAKAQLLLAYSRANAIDEIVNGVHTIHKINLDTVCRGHATAKGDKQNGNYFVTTDGVVYQEIGPAIRGFAAHKIDRGDFGNSYVSSDGRDISYYPFCIDIDGHDGEILPFGYGIRNDGKIIPGARADWWLKRDLSQNETDCCPKVLDDNDLCDVGDIVCQ